MRGSAAAAAGNWSCRCFCFCFSQLVCSSSPVLVPASHTQPLQSNAWELPPSYCFPSACRQRVWAPRVDRLPQVGTGWPHGGAAGRRQRRCSTVSVLTAWPGFWSAGLATCIQNWDLHSPHSTLTHPTPPHPPTHPAPALQGRQQLELPPLPAAVGPGGQRHAALPGGWGGGGGGRDGKG